MRAYLQAGVSVVVIDVVTDRRKNLYAALLEQLAVTNDDHDAGDLYAVACRAVLRRTVPTRKLGGPR